MVHLVRCITLSSCLFFTVIFQFQTAAFPGSLAWSTPIAAKCHWCQTSGVMKCGGLGNPLQNMGRWWKNTRENIGHPWKSTITGWFNQKISSNNGFSITTFDDRMVNYSDLKTIYSGESCPNFTQSLWTEECGTFFQVPAFNSWK